MSDADKIENAYYENSAVVPGLAPSTFKALFKANRLATADYGDGGYNSEGQAKAKYDLGKTLDGVTSSMRVVADGGPMAVANLNKFADEPFFRDYVTDNGMDTALRTFNAISTSKAAEGMNSMLQTLKTA